MPPEPIRTPWWRDPFQPEPSAYEVLGVRRDASLAEINAAASAKLGKIPQRAWKAARTTLTQPRDRAIAELFLYNSRQFAASSLSPERDASCLGPTERGASHRRWIQELREQYPSPPLCHALAIFWFWWTVQIDGTARGRATSGRLPYANDPERNRQVMANHQGLWRNAIGAWASLHGDDDAIRTALPEAAGSIRAAACADARDRVAQTIAEAVAFWSGLGADESGAVAAMYVDLGGLAEAEARSAGSVLAARATFRGRRLVGGRLLLADLGLTAEAQQALGPAAASAISAYQGLAAQIAGGDPAGALGAIAALTPSERQQDEVLQLAAEAHDLLARQAASLGDFPTAIELWAKALRVARGDHTGAIARGMSAAIMDRATQLSRRRSWDEMIDLLDRALTVLSGDASLTPMLIEALTSRGVQRVVQQQQRLERGEGTREDALAGSLQGLRDVERAARLGGRRAQDELSAIQSWVRHLEELGLPGADRVAAAMAAANREDWDTAINEFEAALRQFGPQTPQAMRQRAASNLSIALGNRAFARLSIVDRSGPRERNRQPILEALRDIERAVQVDPSNATARELAQTLRAASYRLIPGGPGGALPAPHRPPGDNAGRPSSGGNALVGLAVLAGIAICCGLASLDSGPQKPTGSTSVTTTGAATAGTAAEETSALNGDGEVVHYRSSDAVAAGLVIDLRRLQAQLERGSASLSQREADLRSRGDALDKEYANIEALRKRYERDGYSEAQEASFKRRVRAYNASTDAFKSEQQAYNAELAELQLAQSDYDRKWAQLKARAVR